MKRELGTFERALMISDQYAPFHIVCVLRLESPPLPQALQESLQVLQERHPFLSMRILAENGRCHFEKMAAPILSFSRQPRSDDRQWIKITEGELSNRLDTPAGQMLRCVYLFDEQQQRAEIILSLFHPIADASSASHFLHELLTACASSTNGTSASDSKLSLTPVVESHFPPAFRGWRMFLHTFRYAFGQVADEIAYRIRTRGKRVPPVHRQPTHGHILSIQIPSNVVEPFAQRARKHGVTLNSALNAALMLAVNRRLYDGDELPLRTFSFANLRPYVQPPLEVDSLACYISMLRFTTSVKGDMDFWSLAQDLHHKMYSSFKAGDKYVAAVMAEPLMKMVTKYRAFRMGATALNYNGFVPIQPSYGSIKVRGVHGFISAFDLGPEFSSQAQLFNEQLFWDFVYIDADMDQDTAMAIVEEVKGIMSTVIASEARQSPIT